MPRYTAADRARLVDPIFTALANGQSLDQIAAVPGWPSRPTLRKWAREDPHLADVIAHGQNVRRQRERYPFDPAVAAELIRRIHLCQALTRLIGRHGLPNRNALNAWKRTNPSFAADLQAAKAFADVERRRYVRKRSRMRFDQDVADRLMLAVLRGATIPEVGRDPSFPSHIGLKRWRRADRAFDAALHAATKIGFSARRRARAEAACSPEITAEVGRRIAAGASIYSLSREPDMPSSHTLYKWVRQRPAFAAEVAKACDFRDWMLADQAQGVLERLGAADIGTARRAVGAIHKKLGQLNPHPGAGRRTG